MGGSPHHHQGEQPPAPPAQLAGAGGGAHQGRDGAGHSADHDVLGGAGLEQGGVEQHVAAQAQQGQAGRQGIHRQHQHQHGHGGEQGGQAKGLALIQPAGRQGPAAGALHAPVEVLLPHAVENAGRRGRQAAAQEGGQHGAGLHGPRTQGITHGHASQGGGQQQGNQTGLGHLQPGGQAYRGPHRRGLAGQQQGTGLGWSTNHDGVPEGQEQAAGRDSGRGWLRAGRQAAPPPPGGRWSPPAPSAPDAGW